MNTTKTQYAASFKGGFFILLFFKRAWLLFADCFRTESKEASRKKNAHPSPLQKRVRNNFRAAAEYAKAQLSDNAMRSLYETGVTRQKRSAYVVALTDALNAPEIHCIDASKYEGSVGDLIAITASDDFNVLRIRVIITDGHGNHVECGEAVRSKRNGQIWKYTAKVSNRHVSETTISFSAFDIPENETIREIILD